jgi:hypothetical protein
MNNSQIDTREAASLKEELYKKFTEASLETRKACIERFMAPEEKVTRKPKVEIASSSTKISDEGTAANISEQLEYHGEHTPS